MKPEQLRELAEAEREVAKRIANREPGYRHDPEPALAARIATMRAEAFEEMALEASSKLGVHIGHDI